MSISMKCPSCEKILSAPDSAAGKQARCPMCGTVMIVPDAAAATGETSDLFGHAHAEATAETERHPCPACGELIAQQAVKCRFCGTELAPRYHQPAPYPRDSSPEADLQTFDWLLCILCFPLGCFVGLIYVLTGTPKGAKMLGLSVIMCMIVPFITALFAWLSG